MKALSRKDIASAAIRYGAMFAEVDNAAQQAGMTMPEHAAFTAVMYGAQSWGPLPVPQPEPEPEPEPEMTPESRDEWWKWAVGVGAVSVAAYAVYKMVTER